MANRLSGMASVAGLLVLSLALLDAHVVRAQAASTPRHTKVALVAETDAVQAGRPLTVGIRLQMEPGWHTYWRNPGDSGLPTRVRWTLPAGFEAGELRWPYPERFDSGPLVSYGYAHEVLLPVELRVPATLGVPELKLAARVEWLECQEICLPGRAEVTLSLPVRAAKPGPDAAAFAEMRRRLPAADPTWRISGKAEGSGIAIRFHPPRRARLGSAAFFATTPHVLDYAKPQVLERTPTGSRLLLPRDPNGSTPPRLAGVLVVEVDGHPRALEVDVAL